MRDPSQCIRERVQRPMGYGPESVGSSCPWQTECVTKGGAQLAEERLSLGPGRLQSLPGNFRQRGLEEVSNVLRTNEDPIQGIGARKVGRMVAARTLVKHFRASRFLTLPIGTLVIGRWDL